MSCKTWTVCPSKSTFKKDLGLFLNPLFFLHLSSCRTFSLPLFYHNLPIFQVRESLKVQGPKIMYKIIILKKKRTDINLGSIGVLSLPFSFSTLDISLPL